MGREVKKRAGTFSSHFFATMPLFHSSFRPTRNNTPDTRSTMSFSSAAADMDEEEDPIMPLSSFSETGKEEEQDEGPQNQIQRCRAQFLTRMQSSLEDVQALGQQTDALETQLRHRHKRRTEARMKLLQEEMGPAVARQEEIERRWGQLLLASSSSASASSESSTQEEEHVVQAAAVALHRELEAQRLACTEMLRHKEAMVHEYQQQLTDKDAEYVQALTLYGEEIEALLTKMRVDSQALRDHYVQDVDRLEASFVAERQAILQAHQATMDALLAQKKEAELAHLKATQEREERFQRELEALCLQDGEDYQALKVQLEMELRAADAAVEGAKATAQVEHEKLVHDHRVLTDRETDKTASLAAQKKKLAKLRDAMNALTATYQEHDGREKKRHEELTQEHRRLQKQYKDLQHRFRHFEAADRDRFHKAWASHESEVKAAVDKVLAIDELIFAQLLKQAWTPPPRVGLLAAEGEGGGEEAAACEALVVTITSQGGGGKTTSPEHDTALVMEQILLDKMLDLIVQEAGFLLLEDTVALAAAKKAATEKQAKKASSKKTPPRRKANISKTGTPLPAKEEEEGKKEEEEEKAAAGGDVAAVTEGKDEEEEEMAGVKEEEKEEEQQLQGAEGGGGGGDVDELGTSQQNERRRALHALGIQEEGEARALLTYFIVRQDPADSSSSSMGEEESLARAEESKMIRQLAPLLPPGFLAAFETYVLCGPDEVVDALQRFLAAKQEKEESMRVQQRQQRQRRQSLSESGGGEGGEGGGESVWARTAQVLPATHWETWQDLEQALVQYHRLLKEKGRVVEGLGRYEEENRRLKATLRTCVEDKVNGELIVPPFAGVAGVTGAGEEEEQKPHYKDSKEVQAT